MVSTKPQGTRSVASATPAGSVDLRQLQRGKQRCLPATPSPTSLQRPLRATAVERHGAVLQRLLLGNDAVSQTLHRELASATLRNEFDDTSPVVDGSANVDCNGRRASLSRSDIQNALSIIIEKQNSQWELRRCSLAEQLDCDPNRARRKSAENGERLFGMLKVPLCMFLHALLADSRRQWAELLSARVYALKAEVQQARGVGTSMSSIGDDVDDVEWSVDHLYKVLLAGLNSAATEEFIVSQMFGGTRSVCCDSIDSFGLLTMFRAPVQALVAQHEALVPSLTKLRRYFAALHPLNGCPRVSDHTDASLNTTEEGLDFFLQSGSTPKALAKALRGRVSPSLRRLLYARALQLSLVVTDGTSLFGGRGELQSNQLGDTVAGCLSFATKHGRDKIRRRMHHSHSTRDEESTVLVLQAMIKVDNVQCVGNSDKYFIFSEETELLGHSLILDKSLPDTQLRSTLKQLGRPSEQMDSYLVFLHRSAAGGDDGKHGVQKTQLMSIPSGFFPLRTCTLLMAPVCYVTGDTVEQYELLSALFGKLWCRIQGPTPELLHCCWMFEALVVRFAASACIHATRVLGFPPLRLAMEWMISAFVEVLEPAELLSFWDLILSYHVEETFGGTEVFSVSLDLHMSDSEGESPQMPCALWLLPLLAASLFVYRAPLVERCATAEDMILVFKEGHHLRCRPLLQYLLFMAK